MSRWRLLTGISTGSQTVPRVMHTRWHICKFDEVLKICDRRISSAVVYVVYKWWAIIWGEHSCITADLHIVKRISSVLRVNTWRSCRNYLATHSPRKSHASASYICTCVFEPCDCWWVISNFDTDFFEDCVSVVFNNFKAFFAVGKWSKVRGCIFVCVSLWL